MTEQKAFHQYGCKIVGDLHDRDRWREEARKLAQRILRHSANSEREAERILRELEEQEVGTLLAADGKPLDYQDEDGFHLMAACGHRVSGGVKPGDRIDGCPNCQMAGMFRPIDIVYPGRLSDESPALPGQ